MSEFVYCYDEYERGGGCDERVCYYIQTGGFMMRFFCDDSMIPVSCDDSDHVILLGNRIITIVMSSVPPPPRGVCLCLAGERKILVFHFHHSGVSRIFGLPPPVFSYHNILLARSFVSSTEPFSLFLLVNQKRGL